MSTSELHIRPYEAADGDQVAELWTIAFGYDAPRNQPRAILRRLPAMDRRLFLVGIHDDRVVATVIGGYDGVRGWAYHLAVLPEARRRGFASAMMAALEERLRKLGCPKVNLQVMGSNRAVVALYESLGYAVEDRVSLGKEL